MVNKYFLIIVIASFAISCNNSKKGSWSEEDKIKAKEDLQEVGLALDFLGDRKHVFIDCYLEKIEGDYSTYDDAKKDIKGCEEKVASCIEQVIFLGK